MKKDTVLKTLDQKEKKRQLEGIELIPSENYASATVRSYLGSYFVNKYSEGYPKKRYYGGNEFVDSVELLAQDRAKKLFHVESVNVQPYSGSPANLACMMALCAPGEVLMGQALTAGGHLTHGHTISASGIFFRSVQYGVDTEVARLFNFKRIREQALKEKPRLIWVGATAHPLIIDFARFAKIADEVGAYLVADISHISGLVVAGVHPSPVPYAHVITSTTHKTLRGPRGAMIMVTAKGLKKDPLLSEKINKAVFPGLQGGPHDNQTAAIAAALHEAADPSFVRYARQIVANSKTLADVLIAGGLRLVGGGTENHLILVDLTTKLGPGGGYFAQYALDLAGLTLNKNTIPNEPFSPFFPSGIRLGTPAMTTRGFKQKEMRLIGRFILDTLEEIKESRMPRSKEDRIAYLKSFQDKMRNNKVIKRIRKEVRNIAKQFPIP